MNIISRDGDISEKYCVNWETVERWRRMGINTERLLDPGKGTVRKHLKTTQAHSRRHIKKEASR